MNSNDTTTNTIRVVIAEGVNTKTFPQAVREGQVKFYRVRENGTTRHVPFLTGSDREQAEAIAAAHAEGKSVRAIAEERFVSVATVRRFLSELALVQQVEGLNRTGIIRVFKERAL